MAIHQQSNGHEWPRGGRYFKYRPPRSGISSTVRPRGQAPATLPGFVDQELAATALNASSQPAMDAFQAPSTVLVPRPARLVGAAVTSTAS